MGGGIKSLNKFNNKMIFDRIFENLKNQIDNVIVNTNDLNNFFDRYKVIIVKDEND